MKTIRNFVSVFLDSMYLKFWLGCMFYIVGAGAFISLQLKLFTFFVLETYLFWWTVLMRSGSFTSICAT